MEDFMKIDWNKKYTTISVYAFLVICASIIFFSIIGEIDAFTTKLGWVVSKLQPFIIGFVMSYLFNFILVFYEEKVLEKIYGVRIDRIISTIVHRMWKRK